MGQLQKVIVVDATADRRHMNAELLTECGLCVIAAESAEDALNYIEEHSSEVAALFTDMTVDRAFDGAILARAVCEAWPEIEVIMTSGAQCAELPRASRFLPKPWDFPNVLTQLQGIIRNSGQSH